MQHIIIDIIEHCIFVVIVTILIYCISFLLSIYKTRKNVDERKRRTEI